MTATPEHAGPRFWMGLAFADPAEYVALTRAAERAGFDGVALSDHIFYPEEYGSTYPYTPEGQPSWEPDTPWPDPWVTIGHLAAAAPRLRFTTNVYVAPARDLFTVAKAVSTAAVLSGGRVALGVGAGWCEDEFDQTGQDFASRGRRLDEMIPALRALWSDGWAEFQGEHYHFPSLRISPVPSGEVPVYVGGDSPAALRRAAEHGDGWIGILYPPDEADEKISEVHDALDAAGRTPDGFEVMLSLLAADDVDLFRDYHAKGVTSFVHAPWMYAADADGVTARVEAIEAFGAQIIAPLAA